MIPSFSRWLRRLATARADADARQARMGEGSHIDPTAQVLGWRQVSIGRGVVLSEGVWLNVNDRSAEKVAIEIGDHCFLGRRNFLSAGALIRLGPYCLTGVDCHFLGADHLHATPFAPYVATGTTLDGIIDIGANCWLGASVTVLKNASIGFGSIVGAGSVVTRALPPFSIAAGHPARVLRRFEVRKNAWVNIDEWPADADAHLPTEPDYTARLRASHPSLRLPVIASGSGMGDL